MKILSSAHVKATEAVAFKDRSDLEATILTTGQWLDGQVYGATDCHIKGTPAERIDFLLRLSTTAKRAADELAGVRGRTATDNVLREAALAYYAEGDR